MNQENQ